MTATIKQTNPNAIHKIYERMNHSGAKEVAVGFPAGMAQAYPDGTPVASVAAWNVYGVPQNNIPARDFMGLARQDIVTHQKEIVQKINGRQLTEEGTEKILTALGMLAQKDIQKAIVDLDTPPNDPKTIKRKGSSNPLIDTGHMLQSVTFVVRNRSQD